MPNSPRFHGIHRTVSPKNMLSTLGEPGVFVSKDMTTGGLGRPVAARYANESDGLVRREDFFTQKR